MANTFDKPDGANTPTSTEATTVVSTSRLAALAKSLMDINERVTSNIKESTKANDALGSSMINIRTAALEAAKAAEKTREAIQSIEKSASQSNEQATQTMEQARDLRSRSTDTSEMISNLINGVKITAQANMESAQKIAELERKSDEIGNIVNAVARIADQTNLLALNAAIEAARAGDHGKGFAVVADEVRNLAELSEKSARAIQDVVQEIQSQVKVVTADTQTAGEKAKDEVQKAQLITTELGAISINFNKILEFSQKIAHNAHLTNNGALEYLRQAEEIASAAEQAHSSVEQSSQAVAEQSKAFSEMALNVESMPELIASIRENQNVKTAAGQLFTAGESMSTGAEEIHASATQISVAISEINNAILRQSDAAKESMEIGDNLESQARSVSSDAKSGTSLAVETSNLIGTNAANISSLIDDISASATLGATSAENVDQLRQRMRQIDKIVDTIVNITIQVNMLAVNGNVEAARAGEFGKGFSVVAADIRSLASESSENADKIKEMVRSISDQIAEVSYEINRAAKTSKEEVERASTTVESLTLLEQETLNISKSIKSIEESNDEAITLLEQALETSHLISKSAEDVSKDTENAAKAANQGASSAAAIARLVLQIVNKSEELASA